MTCAWRIAVLALCGAACNGGGPRERPSVVLITVDTLRADHLSSYGFAAETSPHMDALAAEGVLFTRAIAASSSTAPAHASIMTSRYTREHSIGYLNGETRLDGVATLAEILRDEGYETAAFVGNVILRRRVGLDAGFDTYDDALPEPELNRPLVFERTAGGTTERALAWLATAREPFFLWVHYQDPHGPYTPPAGYAERFETMIDAGEPPLPDLDDDTGRNGVPAYQRLPGLSRPSEYGARYAGEIRFADHWIGRLLASPKVREAIVVLTADHGESLGEDGRYFVHGSTTLPAEAHVPLLLRAPGLAPGRNAGTVSHVDVMPTILELLGLAPASGASGLALGPHLRDGTPLPRRVVFCDMGIQASGYSGGTLLDVRPALTGEGLPGNAYLWTEGAQGGPEDHARLLSALSSYLETPVAMVPADDLPPEDVERMRALGYVD